ncbi:argonaute MEL1-like protein [Tanacetum coccineum]
MTNVKAPSYICGGGPQLLKDDVLGLNDSSRVTIVLGAEVTHFKDKSTPLILVLQWMHQVRPLLSPQPHGVKIIPNLYTPPLTDKGELGGLMREMLQAFKEQNHGRLPDRIIFYRDGVGDEQFNELLNKEGLCFNERKLSSEAHFCGGSKTPPYVFPKWRSIVDSKCQMRNACTNNAKIARKRSKPDKHGHGNG